MIITKQNTAKVILQFLNHSITQKELVEWAENMLIEATFEEGEENLLREILGKLGLIDVNNFGLLWIDCEKIMHDLGFNIKIEATLAA
jgi:hypothetical protein